MPRQVLTNTLSKFDSDMYRVDLQAGDYLAIDVDPNSRVPLMASTLLITAPDGTVQTVGDSREPDTGVITQNPAFGLRATTSGTYYLFLKTAAKFDSGYTLELHRLALAEGTQDPAALQQKGPMYAFLHDNGDGSGTLSFTGPTGYGFAITGNWQRTTFHSSTLVTSTYTVTGSLTLQTAFGAVPLQVPADKTFTVTTKPSTFGGVFGEVKSIQAQLLGSLDNFTGPFTARFEKAGAMLGLSARLRHGKSSWEASFVRTTQMGRFWTGCPTSSPPRTQRATSSLAPSPLIFRHPKWASSRSSPSSRAMPCSMSAFRTKMVSRSPPRCTVASLTNHCTRRPFPEPTRWASFLATSL